MKSEQHRFKVRRLFVLGAGASFSASKQSNAGTCTQAPLDKDFTERISSLPTIRPKWVQKAISKICKDWKDETGKFNSFGLEDAIIRQIGNIEFINAIHPRRRQGITEISDWVSVLSHLITFLLLKAKEGNGHTYGTFATKVFSGSKAADQRDRIITFNYDDLLDRNLKRFSKSKLYFDRLLASKESPRRRTEKFDDPLLVKLHGSVNWRCDSEEFARLIVGDVQSSEAHWINDIWFEPKKIPSPEDNESPLIIPPIPTKPITQYSLFRFLWTKAYEYLHEAEEIVICGYSLPIADRLAASLFGNFTNEKLREVSVVDPDPAIMTKWQHLLRRKNVPRSLKWHYHSDFAEYADQM